MRTESSKKRSGDLGFSEQVYGLGAGIFFLGYFLFEVPSNIMLHHVGAKIWLFLLEGTPAVVLGFVTYFFLDDGPANSVWLKDREKQILLRRLSEDQAGRVGSHDHGSLHQALFSARVWLLTLSYFSLALGFYGVSFWLPQIVNDLKQGGLICGAAVLTAEVMAGRRGCWTKGWRRRRWRGGWKSCPTRCPRRCARAGCTSAQKKDLAIGLSSKSSRSAEDGAAAMGMGACAVEARTAASPVRHPAKRRRIKTVLQEIMYRTAQFIRKARKLVLDFGGHCPAFKAFVQVQEYLLEARHSP